jgi:transcriptional regulator with GAF, ATPase, and Fis domain
MSGPARPCSQVDTTGGLEFRIEDSSAERRKQIRTLITAEPRAVLSGDPEKSRDGPAVTVTLVAVEEEPASDASVLAVIRQSVAGSSGVICYGPGADAWSIAGRCRPLLSGALELLDCTSATFPEHLVRNLKRLFTRQVRTLEERREIDAALERTGIVWASESMRAVLRSVLRIARISDLPVLVTGETGSGKELVARAIHHLDPRRCGRSFVAVNCASISPGIAESELFGHRRGSFTGADTDRSGLIRGADGGVLFLDEIGEMDPALQPKLLRVLQEGTVLGVGEERERPVNVRVVAATNRDLDGLVRDHRFRADLLHRIATISVHVPPLRERREDIAPLIRHFVQKYRHLAPSPPSAGTEFIEALSNAPLAGNVREVENLVRRALVAHTDPEPLGLRDLPAVVWQQLSETRPVDSLHHPHAVDYPPSLIDSGGEAASRLSAAVVALARRHGWNLSASLDQIERLLVDEALRMSGGNQSRAAQLLGISARSVYNKLHRPLAPIESAVLTGKNLPETL